MEKGHNSQLFVSNNKLQSSFDVSLTTSNQNVQSVASNDQVPSCSCGTQAIVTVTHYQSKKGVQSVISNDQNTHCDFEDAKTSNSDNTVNPHTDWSRSTRNCH